MNGLDEVPFKIPLGTLEGPLDKLDLVSAPDLIIPDHEKILQETKYEFRLENWVLTLIQGPSARPPSLSSKPQPSCPPYWLMFGGPQESRLADLLEVVPRQRSHSLTAIEGLCVHHRIKWLISDSEGEDGYSEDDESSSTEEDGELPWPRGRVAQQHEQRKQRECRRGSSQQLLHQQSPCSSTRHRRALSLSLRGGSPRVTCQQHPKRKLQSLGHVSRRHSLTPQPPCSSLPRSQPPPRPSTAEHIPSMRNDKATVKSLSRYSRLPPPPSVARSRNFHATFPDSSAELLSALSQDERDLLETITEQGYPLHAAVVALQKTGRQSLEKVLSYLLAYDHLCKLGYDETQVEEALEMFQNSEAKAAEFLHLLTQFKEMGFQQNVIKEALLVHENHQERALEELMTRAA